MKHFLLLLACLCGMHFAALAADSWYPSHPVVSDTIPPVITCPPSQVVSIAPLSCDTVLFYTVDAIDDQGQVILIRLSGIASGQAFPPGITVNSYLATDLAGNTSTCSFTINVMEVETFLSCNDLAPIVLGPNCTYDLDPFDVLEDGPYSCPDNYIVQIDKTIPFGNGPWLDGHLTANDAGKTYQARVTDTRTNNKCWGNISVSDHTGPVMHCDTIDVPCIVPEGELLPAFLRDSFGISAAEPSIMDACTGMMFSVAFTDLFQNLPCDDTTIVSGIVRRIWTATDLSGNSSICNQVIRRMRLLQDVQLPGAKDVLCLDPDLSTDATGIPYVEFKNRRYPLNENSYCEFDWNFADSIQTSTCAGNYVVKRHWNIFDACLPFSGTNPKTGIQIITVSDTSGPLVQCPADLTVEVQDNNCLATVNLPDVLLSDLCSGIANIEAFWLDNGLTKTLTGSLETLGDSIIGRLDTVPEFPVGAINVLYVATDDCGNEGDCQFRLTVANPNPPTALCDTLLTADLDVNGFLQLAASALNNGSSDDCSPLQFKIRLDQPSACNDEATLLADSLYLCCRNIGDTLSGVLRVFDIVPPPGTIENTYGTGHFSDCNFKVVVSGVNPPLCVAPPDVTVSCKSFNPDLDTYGQFAPQSCWVDSVAVTVNATQFDTLCSKGTITRTFKVFNNGGSMGECSQKIVVNHEQDYFIHFPDDVIVTVCDTNGVYGQPTFFGVDCENMSVTYADEKFTVVPDACYKIERTWTIINNCTFDPGKPFIVVPNPTPSIVVNHATNLPGPVVSSIQTPGDPWASTVIRIYPTDPLPTNYSIYYDPAANGYQYKQIIKVIDNQFPVIANCQTMEQTIRDSSANDPLLWNESLWYDPVFLTHDLCEGSADIKAVATDQCSGSDVTIDFQLYLDLDNDGVQETVINSTSLPPANTVMFGNLSGPGQARTFDSRPVPTNQKWRFAMQQVVNGHSKTAYVRFNTAQNPNTYVPVQLPYGRHRIKWFVADGCGNTTSCDKTFDLKDGKPPTMVCLGPLAVNYLPTQAITLFATDFLQYGEDNCTPANNLVFAIRKAGTGSGFPIDGNGNPVISTTFDCVNSGLGSQEVEIWGKDAAGNAAFCSATVILQDNLSNCADAPIFLTGRITDELVHGIEGVSINIEGGSPFTPPFSFFPGDMTDSLGYYQITSGIPVGANGSISPEFDENPLNGITTFDLVLITKHILGIDTLDSPYKMIAADANQSKTITTFDIVEIRKVILGLNSSFPNNDAWRFVPKSYVFSNPSNPLLDSIPSQIDFVSLQSGQWSLDFVGVKIGDVNNTAALNPFAVADERSAGKTGILVDAGGSEDLKAGETVDLHFTSEAELLGCQFTLNTPGLQVLDVLPGERMSKEHFAVFPDKEAVTMAWEKGGQAEFTLHCRAKTAGNLREMLSLDNSITRAEAYKGSDADARVYTPDLQFPPLDAFRLYQNRPNPFSRGTEIGFNLPEAGDATLQVFDANGKVIFSRTDYYERGMNTVTIDEAELKNAIGLLYYQLQTPAFSEMRKMVRTR